MNYVLTKHNNKWAILDLKTRVYYYGKRKDLIEKMEVLNAHA